MRWGVESFSEWEARRLRWWRQQRLLKKIGLVAAFLAAFAVAWKYLPPSADLRIIGKQSFEGRSP